MIFHRFEDQHGVEVYINILAVSHVAPSTTFSEEGDEWQEKPLPGFVDIYTSDGGCTTVPGMVDGIADYLNAEVTRCMNLDLE